MISSVNKKFYAHSNCDVLFEFWRESMAYFLLSIIGFISANRIMYRFEKFFFMKRKKSRVFFLFLTIPIYVFAIIKEHYVYLAIYIGLILISLIFFSIILEKKLRKVFLMSHLNLINGLLLQIKAGYSVQKAISESFLSLSTFENILFEPLKSILRSDFDIKAVPYAWSHFYFQELRAILKSESRVGEQLEMFKRGLKVKVSFIRRTEQVTRQIKAQAMVSCLVYALIFTLSYYQLNLMDSFLTVIASLGLFLTGIFTIFRFGKKIKWTIWIYRHHWF